MTDKKASDTLDNKDNKKAIHYREIQYGFEWGCAKIVRLVSDDEKGWITNPGMSADCPVAPDTLVDILLRDGNTYTFMRASTLGDWNHMWASDDILAYRLSRLEEEE